MGPIQALESDLAALEGWRSLARLESQRDQLREGLEKASPRSDEQAIQRVRDRLDVLDEKIEGWGLRVAENLMMTPSGLSELGHLRTLVDHGKELDRQLAMSDEEFLAFRLGFEEEQRTKNEVSVLEDAPNSGPNRAKEISPKAQGSGKFIWQRLNVWPILRSRFCALVGYWPLRLRS